MSSGYAHLVGHRFPGGTTRVPGWLNALWCDAVLSEDTAPLAHPSLAYVAALEGCGLSIQDLFDLMGADAGSGVMFGEQRLEYAVPMEVDRDYLVDGEITEVTRKRGRRAGTFDLLTFVLRVRPVAGAAPVVVNTNTYVFPRTEAP